jgi:hypothetical protein
MPRSYATDAALRPQPRRTGLDDWATPDSLCTALAEHILPTLPAGLIWEPAAGAGALVAAMRAAGRRVIATDSEFNFLVADPPEGIVTIATNPPFNQHSAFIERALQLLDSEAVEAVVLLFRHDHLQSESRTPPHCRLSAVARASEILCCPWRPRWIADTTAAPRWTFSWVTWRRGASGPPALVYVGRDRRLRANGGGAEPVKPPAAAPVRQAKAAGAKAPKRPNQPLRGITSGILRRLLRLHMNYVPDAQDSRGAHWSGNGLALIHGPSIFAGMRPFDARTIPIAVDVAGIDRAVLPDADVELQPIVWGETTRDGKRTFMVGRLPNGRQIALQQPIFDVLQQAAAANTGGEFVAPDQEKITRLFVRAADGQIVGVGAPIAAPK